MLDYNFKKIMDDNERTISTLKIQTKSLSKMFLKDLKRNQEIA